MSSNTLDDPAIDVSDDELVSASINQFLSAVAFRAALQRRRPEAGLAIYDADKTVEDLQARVGWAIRLAGGLVARRGRRRFTIDATGSSWPLVTIFEEEVATP